MHFNKCYTGAATNKTETYLISWHFQIFQTRWLAELERSSQNWTWADPVKAVNSKLVV